MTQFLMIDSRLLDELRNPTDLAHARIYDRVLERCVPLKINRQNIREMNAVECMKEARELFASGTEKLVQWCGVIC